MINDIKTPETYIVGASCLLCYGVASAANSSLDKQLKTLPKEDIENLKHDIFNVLKNKKIKTINLENNIDIGKLKKFKSKEQNTSKKDHTIYKSDSIDYLLVININMLGAYRSYSSYIPTMDPVAILSGTIYLIDLNSNKYIWYKPFDYRKASSLEWDEPPMFPGMTNAYYEVITTGKDDILSNFKSL